MAEQVRLRDGTEAWVMPLEHSDRDRFAEEFEKLSPDTRRQRFLAPVVTLTDGLLTALVDEVDGIDHVALILFAQSEGDPHAFEPVAIGRMVRYPDLPDTADLAVTVQDAWQGRGVATALLPVLLSQRPTGVIRVLTEVAGDNPASLAMLRRLGRLTVLEHTRGTMDVQVELDREPGDATTEADAHGTRLHPALTAPWREFLRRRDSICPWLQ